MKVDEVAQRPEELKEQGITAFRAGDLDGAESAFGRALELYRSVGDAPAAAEMQVNMGVILMQRGDFGPAKEMLLSALKVFREAGRRSEEAQVLGNLGALFERAGDSSQAEQYFRQAVDIFRELGDQENEQLTLAALTRVQVSHRKWLQSLFTYEQMIQAGQKLTFKQRVFRWLFRLLSKLMGLG